MRYSIILSALVSVTSALAAAVTQRPYTTALPPKPQSTPAAAPAAEPAATTSSVVATNTNGPQAPRNVAFIAYAYDDQWDGTNTSAPAINVLDLIDNDTGVDVLVINPCDVNAANPGTPQCHGWDFTNSTYWEQIWPDYQKVQAAGVKLFASFGGYDSTTFYYLQNNFSTYFPPIINMLKTYGFDGIDFDIEPSCDDCDPNVPAGWLPSGTALPLQLVNEIRSEMGDEFLITFTPVSGDLAQSGNTMYSGFSSYELDQQAVINTSSGPVKSINWFNPQFYEGGEEASVSNYESVISNGDWDPSRVVILALTSDLGYGWSSLSTYESMIKNLTAEYGTKFGGFGGYEYARAGESDSVSNWQWFQGIGEAL